MGFTVNGEKAKGVHRTISALFYPAYTYKAANKGPRGKVAPTVDTSDNLTGMGLGSAVDREAVSIVNLLVSLGIPLNTFLSECRLRAPAHADQKSMDALVGWQVTMHDYTRRFLAHVNAQQWEPVGCQVPCGSVEAKVATAVDMVCSSKRDGGRLVLIELKCGFERYIDRYSGHMCSPFQASTDCPRNQFQVQLMITRALFVSTYPNGKNVGCVIVRVTRDQVEQFSLAPAFVSQYRRAWSMVSGIRIQPKAPPARSAPVVRREQPCSLAPMSWKQTPGDCQKQAGNKRPVVARSKLAPIRWKQTPGW
jgi:hypothetical protein